MNYILLFTIENQEYGIDISTLEQVISAVKVQMPKPKDNIYGIIDYHGVLVPIINMRKILGLKQRDVDLSDQFILSKKKVYFALWVDKTSEILRDENKSEFSYKDEKALGQMTKINDKLFYYIDLKKLMDFIPL